MKNKLIILNTMIASCILSIVSTSAIADDTNAPGGKRSCYPASKCTGDPNLIGGNSGYSRYSSSQYGNGAGSNKMLQTESTEKITGTIKSVNRVTLPNQTQVQLMLSTDQGDVLVIVGPANFVDQAKVKVQAGDKVSVTGFRIKANGNEVIVAAKIEKNGYTLQLLDDNRQPLWGGNGSSMYSGSKYQNRWYNQY